MALITPAGYSAKLGVNRILIWVERIAAGIYHITVAGSECPKIGRGGIAMAGYERRRAECSFEARTPYFDEGQAFIGDLPGPVLRSWQRCWKAGQHPNRPTSFELVTRGRVRNVEECNRGCQLGHATNSLPLQRGCPFRLSAQSER
jgi:hypothetical protein